MTCQTSWLKIALPTQGKGNKLFCRIAKLAEEKLSIFGCRGAVGS
jgi:hypothetical protein